MKANVAKVTISDDKKSATVELTSKFTKGDYTVTVAQGTNPALTGSVTVEDEKVTKIEILFTSAPLFDSSNSDADLNKDMLLHMTKLLKFMEY
ncbi:hypothetical protein [Fictibacillus sp. KU28468]|uniref:hypothetical protein n=1 Tax=Fictibacillus sp. KU28468 TaxID=2991053 RepID=UPI00223E1FB9|nr:hypothetical protein [Fictibacillus sp. KU28468]UZJ79581.1 hypothetical protein OKX00_03615 [Fictibacillus sp. KU28468]